MGCRCITGCDLVSKEGNPVICGKPDGTGCHDVTTCSRSYLEPIQVPLLERLPERLGRVSGMCVERRGGAWPKGRMLHANTTMVLNLPFKTAPQVVAKPQSQNYFCCCFVTVISLRL